MIYRQTYGLHYEPYPPTNTKVRWSIGPRSNDWKDITIKKSSGENCRVTYITTTTEKNRGNTKSETFIKNIIFSYLGNLDHEYDIVPIIIGAFMGFCLIVLITLIFVYYCKIVRKSKKIEEEEVEKHENPVYNDWDYETVDDNYVKDVNNYYEE